MPGRGLTRNGGVDQNAELPGLEVSKFHCLLLVVYRTTLAKWKKLLNLTVVCSGQFFWFDLVWGTLMLQKAEPERAETQSMGRVTKPDYHYLI